MSDALHIHPNTAASPAAARPSASLVVVRDGPQGIETLLLRRAERGDQNSGAWVFPGGLVDAGDREAHPFCKDLDDAQASAQLGLDAGGLDYAVAALRECFEEAGLLFAHDAAGGAIDPAAPAIAAWRPRLQRGDGLAAMCRELGLHLDTAALVYLSHWVTPLGRPKRFDTRFFIARAIEAQAVVADGAEVTEHRWLTSAEALAADGAGLKLMTPTRTTLELIGRYADVDALLAWARTPRAIPLWMPRVGSGRDGVRPVLPDEPAFAELGRIDPAGHGRGSYDIRPDIAVPLSERVIRVTANNGSVMTGPGTNTYLLRGDGNTWAAIDPGPDDAVHTEAILAAAPGPITQIFVTHTHVDHSPGCRALKQRTGASVAGLLPRFPDRQDLGFAPDRLLEDGERIRLAADCTLRVIHTPGHASNHLCFLLEEEKLLFTGDHLMQLSTVVINPPDGDMATYLASLRSLLAEDIDWLAPGHGFLMDRPQRVIEHVIAHRLKREAKVAAALHAIGRAATVEELLPLAYDDVPPRLHPPALRSLTAHLLKLRDDGRAALADGRWALSD